MTDPAALAAAVADWHPEPVSVTDVITPGPVAALSALLDLPGPVAGPGDPLPPLWHVLYFAEHPPRAALGADGHPAAGPFLPPLPDRRRMVAGGRLRVHQPIRVGDRIERWSRLGGTRVRDGRTGPLLFVTVVHEFRRDGTTVVVEEQDLVYRSGPAAPRPAGRPADRAAPVGTVGSGEPPGPWRVRLATDAVLLFRFSALTANSHRIHYDHPYATGVEGHPGLVVHGPLLALLVLELPRRALGPTAVTAVEHRLSRPVHAGATVLATGGPDGAGGLELRAGVEGAGVAVTATATLGAAPAPAVPPGRTA